MDFNAQSLIAHPPAKMSYKWVLYGKCSNIHSAKRLFEPWYGIPYVCINTLFFFNHGAKVRTFLLTAKFLGIYFRVLRVFFYFNDRFMLFMTASA